MHILIVNLVVFICSCHLTFLLPLLLKLEKYTHNLCIFYFSSRKGSRLGHDTIIDGMLKDGLWDVYNDFGMGVCAEICADQYKITREEQVIFPYSVRLFYPTAFCIFST